MKKLLLLVLFFSTCYSQADLTGEILSVSNALYFEEGVKNFSTHDPVHMVSDPSMNKLYTEYTNATVKDGIIKAQDITIKDLIGVTNSMQKRDSLREVRLDKITKKYDVLSSRRRLEYLFGVLTGVTVTILAVYGSVKVIQAIKYEDTPSSLNNPAYIANRSGFLVRRF